MKNRVLLYGYHGFRNIGAESRLVATVEALRAIAPRAEIAVNTFHRQNLDYLRQPGVVLEYFHPATYAFAGRRRIASADVVVMTEGNMLTESFSKHMVLGFTTAVEQAERLGVPSVGLALDSGSLSPERVPRVAAALNSMRLLTVRAPGAAEALRAMGVTRELEITADCALSMRPPSDAIREAVWRRYSLDHGPVYGIAPVDFFMYPARMALIGRRDDFVRWPFKATWPNEGRLASERLVKAWVEYGKHLLADPAARLMLVVMDPSDVGIARSVLAGLAESDRVIFLSGQELDPVEMSAALSALRTIATSRYHALVMPLLYAVPYIALGHDTRTRFISDQLDVGAYFIPHDEPNLANELKERHEMLVANEQAVRNRLDRGFRELKRRDALNYSLLGSLLAKLGYETVDAPAAATR